MSLLPPAARLALAQAKYVYAGATIIVIKILSAVNARHDSRRLGAVLPTVPEESTSAAPSMASSLLGSILCITESDHTIADVLNRASGFIPCLEPIVEHLYEREYQSWCERCGKYDSFDDLHQCVCDAPGLDLADALVQMPLQDGVRVDALDLADAFVQMPLQNSVRVDARLPDGMPHRVPIEPRVPIDEHSHRVTIDAQSMTSHMLECSEQGGSCIVQPSRLPASAHKRVNDSYLRLARRAIESYADALSAGRIRPPSSIMIGTHTVPSEQGGQYPTQHAHQGGLTTMTDMESCTMALHRLNESDTFVSHRESYSTTMIDMESCTIAHHRHMVLPIRLSTTGGDPAAYDSIANYEGSFRKWTSQALAANRREGFIFKCKVYRINSDGLPGTRVIDFWMGASTVRNEECDTCQLLHERLAPAEEILENYLMPVHMHNGNDNYQKSQRYPVNYNESISNLHRWYERVSFEMEPGTSQDVSIAVVEHCTLREFDGHRSETTGSWQWCTHDVKITVCLNIDEHCESAATCTWIDQCKRRSTNFYGDNHSRYDKPAASAWMIVLPRATAVSPCTYAHDGERSAINIACKRNLVNVHDSRKMPRRDHVCMIQQNLTQHQVDEMLARRHAGKYVLLVEQSTSPNDALNDDGATVDCNKHGIGMIPGTHNVNESGTLGVGNEDGALSTLGTDYCALRITAGGACYSQLRLMHKTPNCICNILSEIREVYVHGSAFTWDARDGRVIHTHDGIRAPLRMDAKGMGWSYIEAESDPNTIRQLLAMGQVMPIVNFGRELDIYVCAISDNPEKHVPWNEQHQGWVCVKGNLKAPGHVHIGMGRSPKLNGLELLRRAHIVLCHARNEVVAETLKACAPEIFNAITADDWEAFVREACALCNLCLVKRPAFGPAPGEGAKIPVGRKWIFDTMHLHVPSAEWGHLYITRFVDAGSSPGGYRRCWAHVSQTAEEHIKIQQRMRAWCRPIVGEIWIGKHDGHPSFRSHEMKDYNAEAERLSMMSPHYIHEDVGNVEVTFGYDVPRANAILRQECSEHGKNAKHFVTAFYTVEECYNHCVNPRHPDKNSPAQRLMPQSRGLVNLNSEFVYSAPVAFLIHPEARDIKFEEHAQYGTYRGPSRESESPKHAWVWDGSRHITVHENRRACAYLAHFAAGIACIGKLAWP